MKFPTNKHHFVYHLEYTDLSANTGRVEITYYDMYDSEHDALQQIFTVTGDNDNTYKVLHQTLHENVPCLHSWKDVEALCEIIEYVYAN